MSSAPGIMWRVITPPAGTALVLMLTYSLAALPLWRELTALRRTRTGNRIVIGTGTAVLAVAGAVAWSEPAVQGAARLIVPVAVMVTATLGGGPVATAMLRLPDPGLHTDPGRRADPDVLHGGAWIGALERIAIAGSLLAGFPEGAAVALGLKSLGRYPELRDAAAAERFIIGTFTSALWACCCGAVGIELLR